VIEAVAKNDVPMWQAYNTDGYSPVDFYTDTDFPNYVQKGKYKTCRIKSRQLKNAHYFKCRSFVMYAGLKQIQEHYDAPWWVAQGTNAFSPGHRHNAILGFMMPVDKSFQKQLARTDAFMNLVLSKYKRWWFERVCDMNAWPNVEENEAYNNASAGAADEHPRVQSPPKAWQNANDTTAVDSAWQQVVVQQARLQVDASQS